MLYLKSLSVSHVCLPLEDVGFCDNCSLWSYTYCLFLCGFACLLFFMQYLKKFVCVSCISSSLGRRLLLQL